MTIREVYADITIENLVSTKETSGGAAGNKANKEEEFRDLAFGMFIHWSLDSVMGSTVSHWMCGAEERLIDQFIEDKPKEFNPKYFDADDIADLARQAGMKYMCFTTKHHNGFCMYDTHTTDFNIMNTPFQRDITKEIVEAFRRKSIVPGFYFSPFDFLWNYKKGHEMHFATPEVLPKNNPELMEYNQAQLRELLTNYGDIGLVFFDGPPEGLKEMVWDIQPECLVTRGEMQTPENNNPTEPMDFAWEACYFMGDSWGYKPYKDNYRSPMELIELLIKTRAMGGNLLLNVAPDSKGRIPKEQEEILREIGLFLFFNQEAIYKVRPWKVLNEGNIWYLKAKDENTVYAFVLGEAWNHGCDFKTKMENWKHITIKGVRATEASQIELVGQTGRVLEHRPDINPKAKWDQDENGLHIQAMLTYRPYDNRQWPYPVAIRITNVEM
ncbi:hypothetical protein BK133_14815 [Paenibacillus sp. FSL H8-0548]|uniref:alpha-L-fucosidase n=1 Tax=Paenibacillus sp. FSL H8-0548 TaxID=1920422 RepID=UPI00096C1576|nr:alpha-L-fucosidase [Paenibacillus sp. FSL H8-0548]OMF32121.1 hypothetical protein BK133_14815 [Paenibacillus sp. FSL H8-0548]